MSGSKDDSKKTEEKKTEKKKAPAYLVNNHRDDRYMNRMMAIQDNLDYDVDTRSYLYDNSDEEDDDDYNYPSDPDEPSFVNVKITSVMAKLHEKEKEKKLKAAKDQDLNSDTDTVEQSSDDGNSKDGNAESVKPAGQEFENSKVIYEADGTSYRILPRS